MNPCFLKEHFDCEELNCSMNTEVLFSVLYNFSVHLTQFSACSVFGKMYIPVLAMTFSSVPCNYLGYSDLIIDTKQLGP